MAAPVRRDQGLTAEVLRLRQRDESEAQAALAAAQQALSEASAACDAAKQAAQRAQQWAQAAEQAFAGLQGSIAAAALQDHALRLRAAQQQRDTSERARVRAEATLAQCRHQLEACRQLFLQRRGLREAAELHAEQQRAAARRVRATRLRVIEEEARERFASAKRRGES